MLQIKIEYKIEVTGAMWINNNIATKLEQNLINSFLSPANYTNLPFYDQKEFISYDELLSFLDEPVRRSWQ